VSAHPIQELYVYLRFKDTNAAIRFYTANSSKRSGRVLPRHVDAVPPARLRPIERLVG
jgi:hypothetical protein